MNKPGRNEPCPCGSGKKLKHCCQSLQHKEDPAPTLGASVQGLLQRGMKLHQAGRLAQAGAVYRQILQVAPNHPDALYLYGLVAHDMGQNETAAELIGKAIGIHPICPFYYSLGNVFHALGRLDEAAGSYRKALQLRPDLVDAHLNLANTLREQGKLDESAGSLRQALSLDPALADAHLNLGNLLRAQGKPEEAIECFHRALALRPDYIEVHNNLGNAFRDQGKLEEAVESFHRVLAIRPECAEVHNNLGGALKEQGKPDEAAGSFHKALLLNPDFAEAHNNLGSVLKEQGKLGEAVESFNKALKLQPDYADAHNNLGITLKEQGKSDEAIACYREALKLRPDMAEAYGNLGSVFKERRNLEPAIACYRQALKLRPDMADMHVGLGGALQMQGQLEEAIESFRKALALKPDCIGAYIGLAWVCRDTGQFDTAKTYLDQALAMEPENPAAWSVLPFLRKMTVGDQPWAEAAQRLLERGPKPPEEMGLCYALGKYNDDTRQYDAAFSCYERANQLERRSAGAFNRDKVRRHVDAIIAAHPIEAVRRQTGGSDSSRPLFIVGMPRSGTSLTEQILASHPDVFGAGELSFWRQQVQKYLSIMPSWQHDVPLLQELSTQYEAELQRHSASALRVVDKMPGNFLYLGLIHAVFPQARILHTRRNPMDTCLSIYFQNLSGHDYANDLDDLAFFYREYHRLMAHWRAVLPPEVFLDVSYEALVEDQEGWSQRVIEFIGLEWDERCLNFHETERKVGTASNWQVRQKIYKTSKERWRNYEKFVGTLLPLLDLAE